ncbi:MAG: transglycosylase domain-containing protein [Pseudotabrizicola sp.]|uniref:transglycosylase domain-containing protein n=1 Tax=Pseudotabrizicola sp. TaxID=2939647 RepID=UPI002731CE58|nr:transglycosylase domain-containing protein [Pseudotabrizicola sp.]MDP2082290.1 transglycosylase domain-containing protein [Pseudotabrizicola sp.]MDZ7575210.1 transglycosylase domain-containing protein [Pseudotabrizicola sp.]
MAVSGNGRGKLTADKRYGTQKATPAKSTSGGRPPRKPAPRKPRRQHGFVVGLIVGLWRLIWRILWGVTWRVGAVVGMVLALTVFYFYSQLPAVTELLDGRARGSVTMLDREGQVFAWRGETFGGQITAENVSRDLHNAVIATEDKRFYGHLGISPRGIAGAIRINMSQGRSPLSGNGGSTITQQVAKLLCLGVPYNPTEWKSEAAYEQDCRSGGVWRKVKEIPYAMAMEVKYSKQEILTIYLNRAYMGAGARGFEAASQRYFGKSANEVGPAEAAMLAGLLTAPSRFAPTNNLIRSQERAAVVVGLMEEQGFLTPAQANDARQNPARLSKAAETKSGGAFADWVMESTPSFLSSATTEDVIIHTTMDQRLQKAAEDAVKFVFETKVKEGSKAQAAIVVMSADGAVRAMVGGREAVAAGSFNRATQAKRQTGSSFKPFAYAAAMDLGFTPADYVEDTPLTINIPGSGAWTPKNYDNQFKGMITLSQALAESRNIPAVRVSEAVGRDAVRRVANGFGIVSALADGPALALGASESSLLEMSGAYAGILNGGSSVTPYGLVELRLQGEQDMLLGATGGVGQRVISEEASLYLTYMMNRVIENGTGTRAKIPGWQAAGKTGTTQAARDAWFLGFTAEYVAGVWMGNDDNAPLTGVTGGGLPAEIWREVMVRVHQGLQPQTLPMLVPEPKLPPGGYYAPSPNVMADGQSPAPVPQPGAGEWQGEMPSQEVIIYDGPVPQDWINEGPVEGDLADQILRDVLGVFGN